MRCNNKAAGVMAAIVALLVFPVVWGLAEGNEQAASLPITIDAKDVDIAEVLRMLGKAAGVNIVVGQKVEGTIDTINLHDVDVETALRIIAEAQGLYWYKDGNVYVVTGVQPPARQREGGQVASPQTGTRPAGTPEAGQPSVSHELVGQPPQPAKEAAATSGIPEPPPPMSESSVAVKKGDRKTRIVTQLIPLKYADAGEIAQMFGGTVSWGSTSGGTSLPTPGSARRRGWGMAGNYTGTGNAASGWHQWGGIGGVRGAGGRGYYGGAGGYGGRGRYGGATGGYGYGGYGGRGGYGGYGGRGYGGYGGYGGGSVFMLPGEMPPPVAFMPQNALLVRGLPEEIDEFREIISFLDQPAPQVEVSVKFVKMDVTELKAWGIDWTVSNGQLEVYNLGFAPGEGVNNVVRFARGRFEAYLTAARQRSRVHVLAEPIVTTQQNLPAEINFYTEIPYFSALVTYNEFGQRQVDFETDYVSVDNSLYVTPRVNADDTVTMELYPEIDQQVGTVEGPNGERVPITSNWYIYVPQVRVADGDTLVIGGIVNKTTDEQWRYTPLLSELPLIGDLFKSRRRNVTNTETLIFVTPRIVRTIPRE